MIKIQPIVRDIVLGEPEASFALTHGFMNMSAYADRISPQVEHLAKKNVTPTSIIVALSRIRKELKATTSLLPKVAISNITTKLPLSEVVYENTSATIAKLESLHRQVRIPREDFFTATVSTAEITIICSSAVAAKITKHFGIVPKFLIGGLAAIGISFDSRYFSIPNVTFSLLSIVARARINIAELVSTYTELVFIVAEKDFSQTVLLFSKMHQNTE
jgi:hypothetical protein